jgi:hypothetical protein
VRESHDFLDSRAATDDSDVTDHVGGRDSDTPRLETPQRR